MPVIPLGWLGRNISTLLLAVTLAVVVWISAFVTSDPNQEQTLRAVEIEVINQDPALIIVGEIPQQARLTVSAPQSRWANLSNNMNLVSAWIDLSDLGPGEHLVPVQTDVEVNPSRVTRVEPETVEVVLESVRTVQMPVRVSVNGEPALGYRRGSFEISPNEVTVSGAESAVSQVAEVRGSLEISGASESIQEEVTLEPLAENGNPVGGVSISPKMVTVNQVINLQGGYKNVVVKVETTGQLAEGYRLTNISVTPPNVVVFSTDPQYVNAIPGYVETLPVDLTGVIDDLEVRMQLNLPPEVSLVGEQSVLVQVGIAAIEGSLTFSLPVETVGLPPELEAQVSPAEVDVIVTGPLPVLDTLTQASFRTVVDVTDLEAGTYQLTPVVDLIPDQVQLQSIIPNTVEVGVIPAPTPTPTTRTPTPPAPEFALPRMPTETAQP